MKCPNCGSPMLVTDETANPKSHVTFYRCSICSGRHVSAEPIVETLLAEQRRPAVQAPALRSGSPMA